MLSQRNFHKNTLAGFVNILAPLTYSFDWSLFSFLTLMLSCIFNILIVRFNCFHSDPLCKFYHCQCNIQYWSTLITFFYTRPILFSGCNSFLDLLNHCLSIPYYQFFVSSWCYTREYVLTALTVITIIQAHKYLLDLHVFHHSINLRLQLPNNLGLFCLACIYWLISSFC